MYQGIFIDNQKADKHFASLMSTPGKNGLTVKFQQSAELIKLAKNILVQESRNDQTTQPTPNSQQLKQLSKSSSHLKVTNMLPVFARKNGVF